MMESSVMERSSIVISVIFIKAVCSAVIAAADIRAANETNTENMFISADASFHYAGGTGGGGGRELLDVHRSLSEREETE